MFFYKIKFHDFFDFWTFINVLFLNTLTFYEKTIKNGYFHFWKHKGHVNVFYVGKTLDHKFFNCLKSDLCVFWLYNNAYFWLTKKGNKRAFLNMCFLYDDLSCGNINFHNKYSHDIFKYLLILTKKGQMGNTIFKIFNKHISTFRPSWWQYIINKYFVCFNKIIIYNFKTFQ